MKTKMMRNMLVCSLLALAAMAPTMTVAEHDDPATGTSPGGVSVQFVGGAGGVICDDTVPGNPFPCSSSTYFGGAIFDVSDATDHDPNKSNWHGDCKVTKDDPDPLGELGKIEFLCASNRDDDAVHTNADTSGSSDPVNFGNDNDHDGMGNPTPDHKADDGYDDMGWTGVVETGENSETISDICFAHDATEVFDDTSTPPYTMGAGAHDWDEWVVFIGGEYTVLPPSVDNYIGTVKIEFSTGVFDNVACGPDTFGGDGTNEGAEPNACHATRTVATDPDGNVDDIISTGVCLGPNGESYTPVFGGDAGDAVRTVTFTVPDACENHNVQAVANLIAGADTVETEVECDGTSIAKATATISTPSHSDTGSKTSGDYVCTVTFTWDEMSAYQGEGICRDDPPQGPSI